MKLHEFIQTVNQWGQQGVPFLFMVDFELQKPLAFKLSEINPSQIKYSVNGVKNYNYSSPIIGKPNLRASPIDTSSYKLKYDFVFDHLKRGDSYLTNLTVKTPIEIDISLEEIFYQSNARYKLLYKDELLVFSPEIFIQIRDGRVYSYPMKGTIDASLPDAKNKILSDKKELSEHVTIVDLIRNDISQIAKSVEVTRFRYLERIATNNKDLLQVSSEIRGKLDISYQSRLGEILALLLPAGSVSGAPKDKTVEIIRQAEGEARGYYTGVFGIFDGKDLDSGVMIRFIEKNGSELYYRSGGGITTQSSMISEYQEAIDKIYVPVN